MLDLQQRLGAVEEELAALKTTPWEQRMTECELNFRRSKINLDVEMSEKNSVLDAIDEFFTS